MSEPSPDQEPVTGGVDDGATPTDPIFSPGFLGAIALHEQFGHYVSAGFTTWQSLYLCGQILGGSAPR